MANEPLPRDGLGHPVPQRLHKVFAGRRRMLGWAHRVRQLQLELGLLARKPFGEGVDLAALQEGLDRVYIQLSAAVPYMPCDCLGRKSDCQLCQGKAWLTTEEYQRNTNAKAW